MTIVFDVSDYDDVKHGKKTMFLRTPDTRLSARVTDWIPVMFHGSNNTMLVEILDISLVKFGYLTKALAGQCGFDDVDELKKYLINKYTTLDNTSRLYAYTFEVVGTSEKVE